MSGQRPWCTTSINSFVVRGDNFSKFSVTLAAIRVRCPTSLFSTEMSPCIPRNELREAGFTTKQVYSLSFNPLNYHATCLYISTEHCFRKCSPSWCLQENSKFWNGGSKFDLRKFSLLQTGGVSLAYKKFSLLQIGGVSLTYKNFHFSKQGE